MAFASGSLDAKKRGSVFRVDWWEETGAVPKRRVLGRGGPPPWIL
jgi:hypothetical protein